MIRTKCPLFDICTHLIGIQSNQFSLSIIPFPIENIHNSILDSHLKHTLRWLKFKTSARAFLSLSHTVIGHKVLLSLSVYSICLNLSLYRDTVSIRYSPRSPLTGTPCPLMVVRTHQDYHRSNPTPIDLSNHKTASNRNKQLPILPIREIMESVKHKPMVKERFYACARTD